jgi:putative hydrolase of the HAD superfamily
MKKIKAIAFDFGNTLASSGLPLNWQEFYRDALTSVLHKINVDANQYNIQNGESILHKYNTRVNNREYEVSSDTIFSELFRAWNIADLTGLSTAKDIFFSFFLKNTEVYPETESVLKNLKKQNIKVGVLTDAAYGSDKEYLISCITNLMQYIDFFLASTDVGFRKPNTKGYFQLVKEFGLKTSECMFVGDEEKDIIGANTAGMVSVLIERNIRNQNFGQKHTIKSLLDILQLV